MLTYLAFQSLSGLSLGLNDDGNLLRDCNHNKVSIPFRAVTGFELIMATIMLVVAITAFQSLSGLSLGLNFRREIF